MAILDFAKAFDTVPHDRLLSKLAFYGVSGPILNWVSLFLKTRDQCVVVEGRRSSTVSVDSGVPQGTVLGPLLFLLHINDLPSVVSSQVRLFADDCLMYRPIRSGADQACFQQDLAALERWGDAWGMRFNAKKCYIMRISRSRSPFTKFYLLCDTVLQEVDSAKYLGVTLTNELKWSEHISATAKRGNSTLGFIRRNLRSSPSRLKETAYLSLVRSVLEYGASIWDPHLSKDSQAIEKIQRRAARFVKSDHNPTSSVTQLLKDLGWKDLAQRRRELRLALLYKIVNGHIAVSAADLNLQQADRRTRAAHPHKFKHISTSTNEARHFFTARTVGDWNKLPAAVVTADTLASFKTRLAGTAMD